MSNDTENEDLIKVYLTELKKTLETRHALVIEEFGKIESSFKNIISNQEDLVKSSQMQEMFVEGFAKTYAQDFQEAQELVERLKNDMELKEISDNSDLIIYAAIQNVLSQSVCFPHKFSH